MASPHPYNEEDFKNPFLPLITLVVIFVLIPYLACQNKKEIQARETQDHVDESGKTGESEALDPELPLNSR